MYWQPPFWGDETSADVRERDDEKITQKDASLLRIHSDDSAEEVYHYFRVHAG